MARAAVLIGVNHAGALPPLRDAVRAAEAMKEWAVHEQEMPEEQVFLFTDKDGRVEASAIRAAIRSLAERGDIEQLIVYFAGHGVNVHYGEFWLLSDAPEDNSAAVNLETSIVLARHGAFDHVVLISDACRTPAEGIQMQWLRGSDIFPNDPVPGPGRAVDVFFATTLGHPAHEIRDRNLAAAEFRAVYTELLLDAVRGKLPAALEPSRSDGSLHYFVRPWPLQDCLSAEMPGRLRQAGVSMTLNQIPDARITSRNDAWVADLDNPTPRSDAVPGPLGAPGTGRPEGVERAMRGARGSVIRSARTASASASAQDILQLPAVRAAAALDELLLGAPGAAGPDGAAPAHDTRSGAGSRGHRRLRGRSPGEAPRTPEAQTRPVGGAAMSERAAGGSASSGVAAPALSVGRLPGFDTGCGIAVRGARAVDCVAPEAATELQENRAERSGEPSSLVRVRLASAAAAANVLVLLDDSSGVLVPALAGFVATLNLDDGELGDIAYEPLEGTARWHHFTARAKELRELRARVSDAFRHGAFRLNGERATAIAARLQYGRHVDPALALQAAYAFHDLGLRDRIEQADRSLRDELGVAFFDLALLTGALRSGTGALAPVRVPWFPMLARGWALMPALVASIPQALVGIERDLLPSPWTHFSARGAARIRELLLAQGD